MTEDLIAKVREAQSPGELLALAHENGMEEFTQENAEELYAQMHTSGELTDEEMENVSGGCSMSVGGQKYTVVTNRLGCINGKWECGFEGISDEHAWTYPIRKDHTSLRYTWARSAGGAKDKECGSCIHLGFTKALTGYCEVSNK